MMSVSARTGLVAGVPQPVPRARHAAGDQIVGDVFDGRVVS